jgi:hypothetical protein
MQEHPIFPFSFSKRKEKKRGTRKVHQARRPRHQVAPTNYKREQALTGTAPTSVDT